MSGVDHMNNVALDSFPAAPDSHAARQVLDDAALAATAHLTDEGLAAEIRAQLDKVADLLTAALARAIRCRFDIRQAVPGGPSSPFLVVQCDVEKVRQL